jgi:hypothetical protein
MLEEDPHPATAIVAIRAIGSSAYRGIATRDHDAVVRAPPDVAAIVEAGLELSVIRGRLRTALQYSRTAITSSDDAIIANARLQKALYPSAIKR